VERSVGVYGRQSKDKKDSISIEDQVNRAIQTLEPDEHYVTYIDKGFSAKNTNRPGFIKMMQDINDGKISKIVIYKLDRLNRNLYDFCKLWRLLEEKNVEFVSVKESFNTSTPIGRAMVYISMIWAQMERETTAERVTDNYYSRIKTGRWPGGPAPYGFHNVKITGNDGKRIPTLEPNTEIETVKRIFNIYSEDNSSLGDIAKTLNIEGIPCRDRKSWDTVAVSRLLHSPVYVKATAEIYNYYKSIGVKNFSNEIEEYTGEMAAHIVNKRPSSNGRKYLEVSQWVISITNFPGTIDADIWLMCQYKLEKNRQIGNSGAGKYTWLSGLIKCGYCKYSISIAIYRGKKLFKCSGRYNHHICNQKKYKITIEEVESAVEQEIKAILNMHNQKPVYADIEEEASNKKKLSNELLILENKIEKLISSISEASSISMKYINAQIEKYDKRCHVIQKQLIDPTEDKRVKFNGIIFEELEFENKKLVAKSFLEKVLIFDEDIELCWKDNILD